MPNKTIEDFAYQVRDYMRSAEVVPGKNIAYSQENNAVIASIENGKSYKVRWTGSATITLKKDSASGTEITSGSISPLSFTADADYDLYFGSSADVTEIMVYDGASTDDTYEPYYVPVKDSKVSWADNTILGAKNIFAYPWKQTTRTESQLSFTDNGDGTLTVNGTPTANAQFVFFDNTHVFRGIEVGKQYILSGAPPIAESTDDVALRITFRDANNANQITVNCPQGGEIAFTMPVGYHPWYFVYYVQSGKQINNLTVKPMIRLASDKDDTYVPYAMTNRELTEVKIDNTYASKNIYLAKSGNIKQMICLAATVGDIKTVTLPIDFYPINDQDQIYPVIARTTGGIYYFAGLNYVASTHSFNANHPYSPNYGQYRDFLPDTMQVYSTIIWI